MRDWAIGRLTMGDLYTSEGLFWQARDQSVRKPVPVAIGEKEQGETKPEIQWMPMSLFSWLAQALNQQFLPVSHVFTAYRHKPRRSGVETKNVRGIQTKQGVSYRRRNKIRQ